MTDKNGILDQIEERLGSEGSHELAAAILPILEREGYITFDPEVGYAISSPMPDGDDRWNNMVARAESALSTIQSVERDSMDSLWLAHLDCGHTVAIFVYEPKVGEKWKCAECAVNA